MSQFVPDVGFFYHQVVFLTTSFAKPILEICLFLPLYRIEMDVTEIRNKFKCTAWYVSKGLTIPNINVEIENCKNCASFKIQCE